MRKRKFAVGLDCNQLLEFAQFKQSPLTLTGKGDDNNWQLYKSTILSLHRHRIVISLPNVDPGDYVEELAAGQEIAVTFKKGYNKCLFVTRIIAKEPQQLESGETVAALTIYRPEQIEKIKRRAFERTAVPAHESVAVTFWCDNGSAGKFQGQLVNISAGGVALKMSAGQEPQWEEDRQCNLQFVAVPGQEPIIATGRFRHATAIDQSDQVMLGFQFIGLELTEQGRGTLRQISNVVSMYDRQKTQPSRSR